MRYRNAAHGHGSKARYLSDLEEFEIEKRDKNESSHTGTAIGAAGGAGALGYGAGPSRLKMEGNRAEQKAKLARLRNMKPGVHDVSHDDLKPFRRAPGVRLGDRSHTARTALNIQRKGYDRTNPVDVNVFRDRAMLTDGAHRLWAQDMRGAKKTPVRITHVNRKSPPTTMRMSRVVDQARQKLYHRRYKKDQNLGVGGITRLADKKPGRVVRRFNEKRSAHGAARMDRWTGGENFERKARIRQSKYAAGGAVLGALALRDKNKKKLEPLKKREPLKTSISEQDADRLISRHGLKGPLPKGLTREQKMAAYEARYVTAGGRSSEKWDRRARASDKIKTGALAVGTGGAIAALAGKSPIARKIKPVRSATRRGHLETAALATGAVGGSAELYAGHARRKRASYASAPGGVAASALRRMQDNTP